MFILFLCLAVALNDPGPYYLIQLVVYKVLELQGINIISVALRTNLEVFFF